MEYNEVTLLEAQGKLPEAIKALNELLASTERATYTAREDLKNRGRLLDTLGALYRTNRQYAEAAATFKRLAEQDGRPRLWPAGGSRDRGKGRTAKD